MYQNLRSYEQAKIKSRKERKRFSKFSTKYSIIFHPQPQMKSSPCCSTLFLPLLDRTITPPNLVVSLNHLPNLDNCPSYCEHPKEIELPNLVLESNTNTPNLITKLCKLTQILWNWFIHLHLDTSKLFLNYQLPMVIIILVYSYVGTQHNTYINIETQTQQE